jgi:DNA processing protein
MPPEFTDEHRALLTLTLVSGVNSARIRHLLGHFGAARAVLRANLTQLEQVHGLTTEKARQLLDDLAAVDLKKEEALLERHKVRLLFPDHPSFPPSLTSIPDPPPLLYLRGDITPADARAVALVGSRKCTTYGKKATERLASGLARAGVTVVSGLAYGIDGIAHRACLEAGGRTLAVLAGGLSKIYPKEHDDLADHVTKAGAVISEASMAQAALPALFPVRNRIISGLSCLVVLIEAAEKSGALITATHAAEQGRTVMAVPGPIDSESSGGCHVLLRQGGVVCRGVEDILEELDGVSAVMQAAARSSTPVAPPAPAAPPPTLDPTQKRIWDLLEQIRSIDELAQVSGVGIQQLSGILLLLEMNRAIRRLPGNRYERA